MTSTSKNLCILRLSAIGDVCHAAAMVNAIQQRHPSWKITWVIGKVEHALLKDMPNVNFVVYDKKAGKKARQEVKNALAETVFDYLFVMQVALRANLLSRVIKAKKRLGFDWSRSKELHWLFTNSRIKPRQHAHVLEGFMDFAAELDVAMPSQVQWEIPVPDEDLKIVEDMLSEVSRPYAVISPAASKAERNWLAERYAAVADYLHNKGIEPILCGGPGPLDAKISQEIISHTQHIQHNFVGKTSLKQMLVLLKGATLVIAPDTGPAHMATTQYTPVIGLYAHSNPKRTGPYLSQQFVVSVYEQSILAQYQKPWQALPWGIRAKGDDLMARISVQDVIEKIDLALNSSSL